MTGFVDNDPWDSFVILTQPRCGSTVLRSMLDATRRVKCSYAGVIDNDGFVRIGGEWHHLGDNSLLAMKIRSLYTDRLKSTAHFGIVLKATVRTHDLEWIRCACFGKNVKVLHLVRPLHEQLISRLLASKTGTWFIKQNAEPNEAGSELTTSFEISRDSAELACRHMVRIDAEFASFSGITAYSRLSYEPTPTMYTKAYREVTDNSDVPSVDPEYRRTIEGDHRCFVSNWGEIDDIFDSWETKRRHIFLAH